RGFVKVLYDRNCGEVYGVHMVAENAADLISEAAVVMQYEGTVYDLARTAHAHPTISEIFTDLLKDAGDST
ncbi:MAG: dihydrolipoyl dehydrogenase, partial [Spirochaetales bacterium]